MTRGDAGPVGTIALVREVIACVNARLGVVPLRGLMACARRCAANRPRRIGFLALTAESFRCAVARIGVAPMRGVVARARARLAHHGASGPIVS